jgi:hypothetical protein
MFTSRIPGSDFSFEAKGRIVRVRFDPIALRDKASSSVLVFSRLSFLEFRPTFGTKQISGLDELGYKSPGEIPTTSGC